MLTPCANSSTDWLTAGPLSGGLQAAKQGGNPGAIFSTASQGIEDLGRACKGNSSDGNAGV